MLFLREQEIERVTVFRGGCNQTTAGLNGDSLLRIFHVLGLISLW